MKRLLISAVILAAPFAFAEEYDTTPAPAEQAKAPAKSPVKEVIVVCKTHFDLGYTHRVKDLLPYYRTTMIDRALRTMENGKDLPEEWRFRWTAPGWVLTKVLEDWPGQTPERKKKLDTAFRDGRFVAHALPFTLETDTCEAEEMARGLVFASALARKTGKPLPGAAKLTDVPGHTNALATVLADGGVKFLHIGCNWPAAYVHTPGLFWWEGPDGSRTLTFYSVNYGTCNAFWPKQWVGADPEPLVGQGLMPPPDWKYDVWPAIIVTPDNSGPPNAAGVKAYFTDAQKKMPGVKFRMGTMEDFADAILKEHPDLPVVKSWMPDTWIHGILSDPDGCKLSRDAHPLIAAAEAQRTLLRTFGLPLPSAKTRIATAYENILLYGEHTFGGSTAIDRYGDAFKTVDPKIIADLEGSWEDKADYIRKADTIAHAITDENLKALADAVKRDATTLVVYNPLPWKRSGEVVLGTGKDAVEIPVSDIPPCGYRTVTPGAVGKPRDVFSKAPATIENAFFKVTLDPVRGAITSLVDKRTGREWIDAADHGVGYLNERFSYAQTLAYVKADMAGRTRGSFGAKDGWLHPNMYKPGLPENVPYRAASPAAGVLKFGFHEATLQMPGDPSNHLPATGLRVALPASGDFVDLELTIKDKPKDNWPEADWFRLPFKVEKPRFSVARALGAMDPATDILPGANRDMYTVGHGLTITGADGAGVAVMPLDHPLVSLDRPGCWKLSRDFVPQKPEVFVNLFNNQWNTNFRYWAPGTHSSRVRIRIFDANAPAASRLAIPALEARNPLQIAVAQGANAAGPLPAELAGISVSRPGTVVTAFGEDPDGHPGTLLRVWEMAGLSGDIVVTLPAGFKATKAAPVDLRGEKTGPSLEINDGKIAFPLKAYAPASFLLE